MPKETLPLLGNSNQPSNSEQPSKVPQNIGTVAGVAEAGLFFSILASFTNKKWNDGVFQTAKNYLFPVAAFLKIVNFALATWDLYKARNKHMGKVSGILMTAPTAAAVTVAVGGSIGAASVFVLAAPIIFLCTAVLDTAYNLGLLAFNLHKWRTAESNDPRVQIYKGNVVKYGLGTLVGMAAIAGISVLMLTKIGYIGLGAYALARTVTGAVTGGTILGTVLGLTLWSRLKKTDNKEGVRNEPRPQVSLESTDKIVGELKAAMAKDKQDNRYNPYKIKRSDLISENRVTGEAAMAFLKEEINTKLDILQAQKDRLQNQQKISHKIEAKMTVLKTLQSSLNEETTKTTFERNLNSIEPKTRKLASSSMFRITSDVDDLVEATEAYFKKS